nr:MAG TPA: tail tube protein [Bacteriophage sp.]
MAGIGLSKPYYALYNANSGTPTYSEGGLIGKATELTLELEGADANNLYADNGIAESDNQFAGGSLTLSTDDLLPEPMLAILGLKQETIEIDGATTTSPQWIVYDDDQAIPYVGFGGIIKKQINNVTKWVAVVLTKIQFANPGISAVTQGETIEWQTKELTATVMRDDSAKHRWQMMSTPLDTEADAEKAIKEALGIVNPEPSLSALVVSSSEGELTGETKITVEPAIVYGNHYVYKTGPSITLPSSYGEDVSTGWTNWNGIDDIAATSGDEIGIVEANSENKAIGAGKATVIAKAGE